MLNIIRHFYLLLIARPVFIAYNYHDLAIGMTKGIPVVNDNDAKWHVPEYSTSNCVGRRGHMYDTNSNLHNLQTNP